MLKLDKSKAVNTLAIHLNATSSFTDLALVYSQSYDLSNGTMPFSVDNIKGQYYIGGVSGSDIPSPSGQYNIDIYQGIAGNPLIWNTTATTWATTDKTWNFSGFSATGSILRSIRAYVSGSNDVSFTDYVSPNELGTYTTYNG